MGEVEMITVTKEDYDSLVDAQLFLDCLEAEGVDNWQGYGDAMDRYQETQDGGER